MYRRPPGRLELVLAALATALPDLPAADGGGPPGAGAGGHEARLRRLADAALPADGERFAGLLAALHVERARHPELLEAYRERLLLPRRAVVRAALEAAQRDGAVDPELGPEVAVDLLGGAFLARAFTGAPIDDAHRAAVFARWWRAIRAS